MGDKLRINVFSPLSYTWERFVELQHFYALLRRNIEIRQMEKFEKIKDNEVINEYKIKEEIYKTKFILDIITEKKIKDDVYLLQVFRKYGLKKYLLEMKIEEEINQAKSFEINNETIKLNEKKVKKI